MTQRSLFWNGVTVGDADLYTKGGGYHCSVDDYESSLHDMVFRMLWNGTGDRGVLPNWLNELEVTGLASPVSVDTGAALIYGLYFDSDAVEAIAIPTPVTATRTDRIVVRRNWATQRARLYRLPGLEGGGAPALVQSPRTYYDVPLANVAVTTGGAVAVTDARAYCTFPTVPHAGSITSEHLVDGGADLLARSTRADSFFVSAQDFQNFDVTWDSAFTYDTASNYAYPVYGPDWAGDLPPGWNTYALVVGSGFYSAMSAAFRVPDNLYGSTLTAYLWHTPVQASCSYYWRTAYQVWQPNGSVRYGGSLYSYYMSGTKVVGQAYRTLALSPTAILPGDFLTYYVEGYNSSGGDKGRMLGIEFDYTGYTP